VHRALYTGDDGHGDGVPGRGAGKERSGTYISELSDLSAPIAPDEHYGLRQQGIQRARVWGRTYAVGEAAVDVACFKVRGRGGDVRREAKGAEADGFTEAQQQMRSAVLVSRGTE
jgi:hypothetical protein